jgi:hypothetical protein
MLAVYLNFHSLITTYMRKLYLSIVLVFLCIMAQGQTYLYQGFGSGYWPPEGWTALPIGPQWSLSPTNHAGGILPEARLQGFTYTGTVRLMSPLIDMTEADTVILSFRYFPEINDTAAPVFGVSTRTGGGSWTVVWETVLKNSNEPREFEVLFTGDDLGNPYFQFSFFLQGDMTMLFNLYLDNIRLYYPTTADGKLDEILTPAHVEGPVPVEARVLNLGNTTIHEVMVTWLTNTGIKHDSLLTGLNLGLYESFTFQFDRWWVSPFGDYGLKMWISSLNGGQDPYHPNDTLTKLINYSLPPRPMRPPCLETFTAAWCQPCASWAEVYDPWCEDHPEAVVIKYQISSDPYATPEGEFRIDYYDLHAIPYTFCNGKLACNVDTNKLDTAYYPARKLHSDFIINSSFTVIDSIVTINNNIFPYITTYGTRVQTVVLEKTTYGNVMGNGQTEFHNVEMKMFPEGGEGEIMNFCSNLPYTRTYTADLASTNIEEFDDLLVAVFIQQDSNKQILQSAYALEDVIFSPEDRLSMITLNGVPLTGFDPDIHTYDVEIPQSSVESPVVVGIPMNEKEMVVTQQAFDVVGAAVIDAYPESRGTFERYIVNFSFSMDVIDAEISAINVFPNPTNGKLFLTGVGENHIRIYNIEGKLVLDMEKCMDYTIDVSGLNSGIYILSLFNKEGLPVVKKIVIM